MESMALVAFKKRGSLENERKGMILKSWCGSNADEVGIKARE